MQKLAQKLINKGKNSQFIREVFEFAQQLYGDKKWIGSQDLYLDHALRMALLLREMNIDETTIAVAILYGIADTSFSGENNKQVILEIQKKFGAEIATLVTRASELNKIYYSFRTASKNPRDEKRNENLRKMFFAIAQDVRVILVKIASRIDGLNRFDYLSKEAKERYATETLDIYVPIANRLGLGEIKRRLEDLAFSYLHPEQFTWLQHNIKEKYEERQQYLEKFIPTIKKLLKKEQLNFITIDYRAKSYWSTYQKLQRHNMDFEKIYDLVALRLIVKDVSTCYRAVGIIHKHYPPMSGQIQDYIAKPKENGYQSLHTTVFLEPGRHSEIQIKTAAMHNDAQFGICAHWAYKENIDLRKNEEQLHWAQEVPEFWKTFKIDFFENEIFAFTPKGDVIVLPYGSTAIDFAYAVHSDIGNHCEAAKIDGKIIPLAKPLQNGDIVEIITSSKKKPSQDWLKFVKTGFAKSHIKKILTATFNPIFSVPTFIKKNIFRIKDKPKPEQPHKKKIPEVYIAGQKGIAVTFAQCCSPQPSDEIKAYISKYRPATLHKTSCKTFKEIVQKFPEKIIDASWEES